MQSLKIVVCGDGAVGKTTFLISFTLACFPTEYIPTVFDNYSTVYEFEGRKISLGLWDTAGQEDFQTIRPLSYKGADVFLMFFSVALPSSAENIKAKWLSEIRQHCPETPVYLIASQTDLRENPKTLETLAARKEKPLSTAQGQQLAKDIKAFGYSELCSMKETMDTERSLIPFCDMLSMIRSNKRFLESSVGASTVAKKLVVVTR